MAAARRAAACTRLRRWAAAVGLGLAASAGWACGHCVEDRMAAVYDHAWIAPTLARGHRIAFVAIDGPLAQRSDQRLKIERAVAATPGIDTGSLRISLEAAALSLSFDPRRVSWPQLRQSLQRRLALQGLSLQTLRIMTEAADFTAAETP